MTELHEYTALELHQLLQRRQVSPVELAQHFLDRIARLDGAIGAFATVTPEAAIARARHSSPSVSHTSSAAKRDCSSPASDPMVRGPFSR